MSSLLTIRNVEKHYGTKNNTFKALAGVSLDVNQGEFLGIMGASGSGKSTLLNMVSTIDRVTSGDIHVEGQGNITKLSDKQLALFRKTQLGFVFQEFNLLDTLTIEENIVLPMSLQNVSKKDSSKRAKELMERLGIAANANKFPYQVSGGQKQRTACARALANNPKLILADEPTGALDSKSATMLLETFKDMNENMKVTILMVTHDAFSSSYCSRILFLQDGKIYKQLERGTQTRREFLGQILDTLSVVGGDGYNAD